MKVVMTRIIAAIPFLGLPFIGPIVGFFLGKLFMMISDQLILMVELKLIDIRVGGQVEGYDKSVEELKAELAKPIQNEAAINEAKEKLKKNLRELINMRLTK